MVTLLGVLHIVVCLMLITLVLSQDPKGGSAGGMFGTGGSNSLLGATGATTLLTKLTRWSAIIFGLTCLALTILTKPDVGSVIDAGFSQPAGAAAPAPQAPADPAVVPGGSTNAPGADPNARGANEKAAPAETAPAQPADKK